MSNQEEIKTKPPRLCCVEGCFKLTKKRYACGVHYYRMYTHGTYDAPLTPREKTLLNNEIKCKGCNTLKSVHSFREDKRTHSGYTPYCIHCNKRKCAEYQQTEQAKENQRNNHFIKNYGISLQVYNEMVIKQNNVCAICNNFERVKKVLSVDHCHKTGKVRGLLCSDCNNGLGQFKDDCTILNNAIKYLMKS